MAAIQHRGTVLITGTSTGIGRATALRLDQAGYTVFAGVRKEVDAQQLRQESSDRLCPVILDITVSSQVEAAAALLREKLGPDAALQGLVNNAGICQPGSIEFIDMERFRYQFEVNLMGHVTVIQAFLPMIRQGRGRIINVASAIALAPLPLLGAYVASKCAMQGLSEVLRREVRWLGIPVSTIEPGAVDAPIFDKTPSGPEKSGDLHAKAEQELYGDLIGAVQSLMQQARRTATQPVEIAKVIQQALEARWPRARYRRGPGSTSAFLGKLAPAFISDWVVDRILKKQVPTKFMGW